MTEQEIQAAIVDGGELTKIKTIYQGVEPQMVVKKTNGEEINIDLDKGFWGRRVPSLENGTLVLPTPRDLNPISYRDGDKIVEIYSQDEYLIPCEQIDSIKFSYKRKVETSATPVPEN